jgi:recombination protein RecR
MIPQPLEHLIKQLARLPGLGPRSAQRTALALLENRDQLLKLQQHLSTVGEAVKTCQTCGNLGLEDPCHICTDEKRDAHILCVVEGVDDLWALERSGAFRGRYHVLGGVISAIDGIGPDDLNVESLLKRVEQQEINEVIFALSASVDGQTTSHLITRKLKAINPNLEVTALAKGIPVGADVDYLDEGTLSLALQGRQHFG